MVTNTLVANGAAAAAGSVPLSLSNFLDLSALFEATVLLDRLEVVASPDVIPEFPLTAALNRHELLVDFVPRLDERDFKRSLMRLPEPLARLVVPDVGTLSPGHEDLRPAIQEQMRTEFGSLAGVDYNRSIDDLLIQFAEVVLIPSLHPDIGDVASARINRVFRSNWYMILATANGLDYFPDFDRAPFVSSLIHQMYRSLPTQLYSRVAEALGATDTGPRSLVSEWTLDVKLPIPPVTALVLDRASTLDEIPERLLQVRDEFADYRSRFRSFKYDLQTADTLEERRRLERRYQQLLQSASGPDAEIVSATEVLNMAEKVAKVAAVPHLATSYSASLILQPVEWIRRWWLRRPLAVLFRMDSKLPRLSEYSSTIERLWGERVHDDLLDQYSLHAGQIGRLMEPADD
ncbi:MAG: hypothetical protein EOO27_02900 [Comamonadaceae bacterium]|nr:MAG: hypothetical protein EOO27_02900 [Comamonadaceae bacterium]